MKWLAWPLATALALSSSVSAQETQASVEKPLVQTAEQKRVDKVRADVMWRGAEWVRNRASG